MRTNLAALAVVASLVSACAPSIPRAGLVVVHVGEGVAAQTVTVTTTGEQRPLAVFAAKGARYWDAVGAHLRVDSDLDPSDDAAAAVADLSIVPSTGTEAALEGDATGWYSHVDGKVHIKMPLNFGGDASSYATMFAHEFGHAFGLGHVNASCAVMNATMCDSTALHPADVAAFDKL